MKKQWEVNIDGVKHVIEYKTGLGNKIFIDGELHKVRSANWFINLLDYSITFGSTECRLVVIGNKVDLAVDGTYLGSKEAYKPLSNTPAWVYVLAGISILGGYLLSGLISLLVGVLMSMLYVKMSLDKKTGAVIALFAGCTVIQILVFILLVVVQVAFFY